MLMYTEACLQLIGVVNKLRHAVFQINVTSNPSALALTLTCPTDFAKTTVL